jgi:hypothetical protein
MTCDDAKKLLPGWVLDEIDVEPRREVEKHLETCGGCRAERDGLAKAHASMKTLPEVETSQARRDAVVTAMAAARNELLERAAVPRPRRTWPWAAAAAVLLAAASWIAFGPSFSPSYRIKGGRGLVVRPHETVPVADGVVVRRGDRVVAEAPLTLEGSSVTIELSGTLALQPDEFLLESGSLTMTVHRGEVVVSDVSRDRLVLRAGRFHVEVFQAKGAVAAGPDQPVKEEFSRRLRVSVRDGSARLEGEGGAVELKTGETGELDPRGFTTRGRSKE